MFGIDDALLAVGGKILGGIFDNSAAADRQDSAQTFSAGQYATRYQTQVADMKAAGLNPMLAYTQAPGNSPGGVVSSPGNQYSGAADTYLQSKMNSAQVANIMADTENKKASADLIEAQAENQRASAAHARSGVANLDAQTKNVIAQLENIPKEGKRLDRLAELLYQQANLAGQQQLTESQRYDQVRALVSKIRSETKLLDFDIEAADSLGNSGRLGREVKPFYDMLRGILRK